MSSTQQTAAIFSQIEQLGKLTGVATAALLTLSVFYDYNYLLALDLSFTEVPTEISDHLRSAIVWLPYGLFLTVVNYWIWQRIGRGDTPGAESAKAIELKAPHLSATPDTSPSDRPRLHSIRWRTLGSLLLKAFFVVWCGFMIYTNAWRPIFYAVLIFLWWNVVETKYTAIFDPSRNVLNLVFGVGPLLLALVGIWGYVDGMQKSPELRAAWNFTIKSEAGPKNCYVDSFRTFSTSVVLKDALGNVLVVHRDRIVAVSRSSDLLGEATRSCLSIHTLPHS